MIFSLKSVWACLKAGNLKREIGIVEINELTMVPHGPVGETCVGRSVDTQTHRLYRASRESHLDGNWEAFSHDEDHVSPPPFILNSRIFWWSPNVENMLQLVCLSSPLEEKMSKPK